jgi:cobalt-zinc-cadmium efflux system membrane fusion protein
MSRVVRLLSSLLRGVPTLLVLAGLAALAYWGHHSGWQLPRLSVLLGGSPAAKDDWCAEHAVPESECVECNPELMPRGKEFGWCPKHGINECPFEHPEIAQLSGTPTISLADLERAERALALLPRPDNNSKCKLHHRRIQFASVEAVARAGVEVKIVWRAPMVEYIAANGEITYDQTRVAHLSSRAPGTVWRMEKKVGDPVKAGETIALIESQEVGRAKADFLQAVVQLRLKSSVHENLKQAGSAIAQQRLLDAASAVSEARIRLVSARQALVNLGLPLDADAMKDLSEQQLAERVQFLGLPDDMRRALDPRTTTANLLPIQSPVDGVVVEREVVAGEVVDTAKLLLTVADVRRMWLTLNPRLEDARRVAVGQVVRFREDGGGNEVTGTISWISTAVDEKTRTVKVRVDLANPDGRLRANTYGTGRVVLREEKDTLVVPNEAVHWEGDCHVVFVRDKNFLVAGAPKVFHVRKVRPGAKDEQYTEILAGVLPGEVVAARGSGVLRAELLRGNLGEG